MPINLSALAPITTAATSLSNLILVTPQSVVGYAPQTPANPNKPGAVTLSQSAPAILFHYEGEQTATLSSDITDHFVEDNSAVQDQIALRPIVVNTHGYIGELNDVPPYALALLKQAADKLTAIGPYAPQLSATAQLAYAEAFLLYQVSANAVNSAVSAWSSVSNAITGADGQSVIDAQGNLTIGSVQSEQQKMFQQFYGYWQTRTLFTVQTPWAVLQNMAIVSLTASQDETTNVITDFNVSFKQIRTASTAFGSGLIPKSLAGRSDTQAAPVVNQGSTPGTPTTETTGSLVEKTNNPTGVVQ